MYKTKFASQNVRVERQGAWRVDAVHQRQHSREPPTRLRRRQEGIAPDQKPQKQVRKKAPLPSCPHLATDLQYKVHATSVTWSAFLGPSHVIGVCSLSCQLTSSELWPDAHVSPIILQVSHWSLGILDPKDAEISHRGHPEDAADTAHARGLSERGLGRVLWWWWPLQLGESCGIEQVPCLVRTVRSKGCSLFPWLKLRGWCHPDGLQLLSTLVHFRLW